MSGTYDDIIDLPHPISKKHPRMPIRDRAAQFAPFAALVGYDDAVEETARVTDSMIEQSEEAKAELDRTLSRLSAIISSKPRVAVTYFLPDERKSGGEYKIHEGELKSLDNHSLCLQFADGKKIFYDKIANITIEG